MNQPLPEWAVRLLDLESSNSGEGVLWQLETDWTWAPWFTLLFICFATAWVIFWTLRESADVSRRTKLFLATLRLASIGVLLCILTEFTLSFQQTGLPHMVVMVDRSASMSIADQYPDASLQENLAKRLKKIELGEPTRFNLAKLILLENNEALLSKLRKKYNLSFYFIGESTSSETTLAEPETTGSENGSPAPDLLEMAIRQQTPSDESSRLGRAVRSVLADLRGTPPAAILIFTDGIVTDGPTISEAAKYARRKGVPLYSVALGTQQPVRDIELSDLLVDEVVFLGDVVHFDCTLTSHAFEGEQVEFTLSSSGSNEILARKTLTLGPDGIPLKVRLSYRPTKVGEFEYVMEIKPLEGESQVENNRIRHIVSVREQKIRVLLAWAYPSYEFRYLKHLLDRNDTIDVTTVLQSASPDYAEVDRTARHVFPVSRDDLYAYDIILFGDVDPSRFTTSMMSNIEAFVEKKGGSIVFVSGTRYLPDSYLNTPLEKLFPLVFEDLNESDVPVESSTPFPVRPTEIGIASPPFHLGETEEQTATIWKDLSPIYWFHKASDIKPGTRVLAEHPTETDSAGRPCPLICLQYVGAGRVLFHSFDSSWRWRFQVGDRYFARYWVQMLRFLARAKLLDDSRSAILSVDRRLYRRGETARLRARFYDTRQAPPEDDGVEIIVEQAGGKKRRVRLKRYQENQGLFEATLSDLTEGTYHAWMATPVVTGKAPSVDFLVEAPPGEFEQIETNFSDLSAAAVLSQGRAYDIHTVNQLIHDLPQGRPIPIRSLPPEPLWSRWWPLFIFLTLLTTEWIYRKRLGML